MSKDDAIRSLIDLADAIDRPYSLEAYYDGDPSSCHAKADEILLAFIRGLGYDDVACAWEAISPKWYE
jgi:hypothetical protein